MKNKLHYSFLLGLTIIGILLVLSLLPELSIGPISFKKVDLLSDIRIELPDSVAVPDSTKNPQAVVAKHDSIVKKIKEGCVPGLTCIEDYSNGKHALTHFVNALNKIKK